MIWKCFSVKQSSIQSRFRSWFFLPAHRSVFLPWLSALQHCCASRCSVLRCQFLPFSHFGEGTLLRERCKSDQKEKKERENPSFPTTEAASLFSSVGRRGGLVSGIGINTLQGYSERPAAVSSTTPVMRCSEQRRRATGMLMPRRETCWRRKNLWIEVSQRTLYGRGKKKERKKNTRVPLCRLSVSKLKWLNPRRRCPYLRAPLSAAGGAPPSSCSGLLLASSRAPPVSSTLH